MKTIVHLSDIHFGKFDPTHIKPLLAAINKINPHLIIISGDLTQRARLREFQQARSFLAELKSPYLVIPGNHDIHPEYKPFARFMRPYSRYQRFISRDLEPTYVDDEVVVASINTVRASTIKNGRVNWSQIKKAWEFLAEHNSGRLKIIVTHHPFDLPRELPDMPLVGRAKTAVKAFSMAGVDMYLSGHLHHSSVVGTAERHKIEGYSAIAVQAGTVSIRLRSFQADNMPEGQSFNVIIVNKPSVTVNTYSWNPDRQEFKETTKTKFSAPQTGLWQQR